MTAKPNVKAEYRLWAPSASSKPVFHLLKLGRPSGSLDTECGSNAVLQRHGITTSRGVKSWTRCKKCQKLYLKQYPRL